MYQFTYFNYAMLCISLPILTMLLCIRLPILEFNTVVLNVFYLELKFRLNMFINKCQLIALLLKFQTL